MISIYPIENETLVVSLAKSEILNRLSYAVNNAQIDFGPPRSLKGWVTGDRFNVTAGLRRPHPFFPQVSGHVESTSKGSLVFMKYMLFPGTRLLLTFWSAVLPLASIGIAIKVGNLIFPLLFTLFVVVIHIVARANFRLHVKTTRYLVHRLLQDDHLPTSSRSLE